MTRKKQKMPVSLYLWSKDERGSAVSLSREVRDKGVRWRKGGERREGERRKRD